MRQVKNFFADFINFFILIVFEMLGVVVELTYQTVRTIKLFAVNVIYPNLINFLSDVNYLLLFFLQIYFEVSSNICLYLSKLFLKTSKFCHDKSEQLIEKTWAQY